MIALISSPVSNRGNPIILAGSMTTLELPSTSKWENISCVV